MKDETINVLIAGDFSPKERIQQIIDSGSYHQLFPMLNEVERDAFIVNYETVIVTDEDKPIIKSGAHLKTTDKNRWMSSNGWEQIW